MLLSVADGDRAGELRVRRVESIQEPAGLRLARHHGPERSSGRENRAGELRTGIRFRGIHLVRDVVAIVERDGSPGPDDHEGRRGSRRSQVDVGGSLRLSDAAEHAPEIRRRTVVACGGAERESRPQDGEPREPPCTTIEAVSHHQSFLSGFRFWPSISATVVPHRVRRIVRALRSQLLERCGASAAFRRSDRCSPCERDYPIGEVLSIRIAAGRRIGSGSGEAGGLSTPFPGPPGEPMRECVK